MESKKRKIEAFLAVANMNDDEGRKRQSLQTSPNKKPKVENEQLSGEALDELRRRLKERKKKLQSVPNFQLKTKGHSASLAISEDLRTPLFVRDLQHLLLYALMGSQAPVEPSQWCKFEQWSKLRLH